jgi:predicted esterase
MGVAPEAGHHRRRAAAVNRSRFGSVLAALLLTAVLCPAERRADAQHCVGDCDGDGTVQVNELLEMVNVALGNSAVAVCTAGDVNSDGTITVDEILAAVGNALNGCPVPTATPAPTEVPTPARATALFSADPSAAANPFPSDRLRDAGGHVAVPVSYLDPGLPPTAAFQPARDYLGSVASQLQVLTGFGTYASLRIPFDQPVALPPTDNPSGILLLQSDDLAAPPAPIRAAFDDTDSSLEVQPVLPLKPNTRYALVLTTALVDHAGIPIHPSVDFAAVLAGSALSAELAAWRTQLQPVLAFLNAELGIATDSLALVDVFTTEPIVDDLVAIDGRLNRNELVPGRPSFDNSPIPGLQTGIFQEGTVQFQSVVGSRTSSNIAAVGIGTFASYDFRTGPSGAFDPRFVTGGDAPGQNQLDFYMTIPKAAAPPDGYPITIFGHGLGGSGLDVVNVSSAVGNAPMMAIGISALQNGRRGSAADFFVFDNLATSREYLRQTVADLLQLTHMIQNAHRVGIAPFDQIDPNHILYFGGSLGGILGTMFMALEPDIQVAMLSVPGGGLPTILQSPLLSTILTVPISQLSGIPDDDPNFANFLHRLLPIIQWVWDPGDPINYAPYVLAGHVQLPGVPPKRILMHEGIMDAVLPNANAEALALAMRLPDLKASKGCMAAAGCTGIWRFVMTEYGQPDMSGHGVTTNVPQAHMQAGAFLTSFGTQVTDASP